MPYDLSGSDLRSDVELVRRGREATRDFADNAAEKLWEFIDRNGDSFPCAKAIFLSAVATIISDEYAYAEREAKAKGEN